MKKSFLFLFCIVAGAFGQSKDDYGTSESQSGTGFLDPSKISINHSLSFGMSSYSGTPGLQSQGLYATMMQYKFSAPVTLNLNFGLPIFSTYSSAQNLTTSNLKSMDYFKSMPFDFSLTWKPSESTMMRFSLSHDMAGSYFADRYYDDRFYRHRLL
ncbi:MAG: hypothetical protein GX556_00655, partial [Fibrobacter sp.]|nr:hypothetical protein [Fibrobacter sp.]